MQIIEPARALTGSKFSWKGTKIRAMAETGDGIRPEGRAYLTLSRSRMLLFDRTTGLRL
jgi:hypothetical protein